MSRLTRILSEQGRKIVETARRRKGRTVDDEAWLQDASKRLQPDKPWDEFWKNNPGNYAVSLETWRRFYYRRKPIGEEVFKVFCDILDIDWETVIENENKILGFPPELSKLYGRTTALKTIRQWITNKQYRLIILCGRAGVGKTTLARQLLETIPNQFDLTLWLTLGLAPSTSELLNELTLFLSEGDQQEGTLTTVMNYLRKRRCLIVLDDWETIMEGGNMARRYREDYQGYGEFLRRISKDPHQSCVLLLSREDPRGVELKRSQALKLFQLEGLSYDEDKDILDAKGLSGTELERRIFLSIYSNPLILELVAETAKLLHNGNISKIVQGTVIVEPDVYEFIDREEFQRLSIPERDIVYWLAIRRNVVSYEQLSQDTAATIPQDQLQYALKSLIGRRSIVKSEADLGYVLDPVLLKYVTHRFVKAVSKELLDALQTGHLRGTELFISHAFITPNDHDAELNAEQLRRIVKPIANQLLSQFPDPAIVHQKMQQLHQQLEQGKHHHPDAAQNLSYLLHEIGSW